MSESQKRTLTDKITLRMPEGLRERIKIEADRNSRSLNSEIIDLLEEHFPPPLPTRHVADAVRGILTIENDQSRMDALQGLITLLENFGMSFSVDDDLENIRVYYS